MNKSMFCQTFVAFSSPLSLLITSDVMWCDITLYDWFKKFYGFYMAAVFGIASGRDVSIHTRCGNYPNKSKLVLYKPLLHYNNHLKQL